MDKQSILENIKETQARIATIFQEKYPDIYPAVKTAEAMDLTPYIDKMAEELMQAFDVWKQNMESDEPLGHVHIEWSYEEGEALAYGYAKAEITPVKKGDMQGFCYVTRNNKIFYEYSAFCDALMEFREATSELEDVETPTEGTDYQIAKIAEIFWYAMEKATLSDAFKNLNKASEITFELARHDRLEIIGYIWKDGVAAFNAPPGIAG